MKNKSLTSLAVPLGVVGIVLLLVVPLPSQLLDVLIALNITVSLVILLTAMYVKRPLDFSVFPSLILVFTLFRLGLNVASTRLVLRDGFAGHVIDAFGHFVVGGSLVIGLVIFLILVVIQFAVITNGAGRVAEVGARFTLDAMPGKQMAIDADLNSGLIDEDTARRRRADVAAEADFYGAMDGGSKFVKGDAIAGIVITIINLIGGFVIGMVQMGMSAGDAAAPVQPADHRRRPGHADPRAAAVGRPPASSSRAPPPRATWARWPPSSSASRARPCGSPAAARSLLALLPGMPKLPFMLVGAHAADHRPARRATPRSRRRPPCRPVSRRRRRAPSSDSPEQLIEQMRVHTLEILLAPDLVDLVGSGPDQDLLARVRGLRRKTALELGIVVPPVRTRDSVDLPRSTYVVKIAGVEVGRGEAPAGRMLALGDDLARAARHRRATSPCSACPASGSRPSCGTPPRCPARPSSTASPCSSRTSAP